jgi:hypothetical protein
MTSADRDWLKRAEQMLTESITAPDEINLRFSMGKFCDDTESYEKAFNNYKRANDLLKANAEPYDRQSHSRFVDDLVAAYPHGAFSSLSVASESSRPVFVVGMMRSGTSLVEQIIASHPLARGAGELAFWTQAASRHEVALRSGTLDEALRRKLAAAYLRLLGPDHSGIQRVVDKAPINADYLGMIHSVFPRARIIYMQRDPIDTCLSCYFQQFSAALNFTHSLDDLAHYYRQHRRLMDHWRSVLPAGTILEVPYAELVADQELWTRKILDHIALEWDESCLSFYSTRRTVVTASAWQVRQGMYQTSVERWRNYQAYVAPLIELAS